jgi:cell division control protein 6
MDVNWRGLDPETEPRRVRHRHDEIQQLLRSLQPLTDGAAPEPIFVFGASGVGKTTLVRQALRDLKNEAPGLPTHRINCRTTGTRFATLKAVGNAVGAGLQAHPRSTSEVLTQLHGLDEWAVVVLDEANQLDEPEVLIDLYECDHIATIGIANDETRLFGNISDPTGVRLTTGEQISVGRYSRDELVDILGDRAQWALGEHWQDFVARGQLRTIAEYAQGNARSGIMTLREAVQNAVDAGADRVTDAIIEERAIDDANDAIRTRQLSRVSEECRLVFELIDEAGELDREGIYARYCERVPDPRTTRTVGNWLGKLVDYGLIERRGPRQDRTFVPAPALPRPE